MKNIKTAPADGGKMFSKAMLATVRLKDIADALDMQSDEQRSGQRDKRYHLPHGATRTQRMLTPRPRMAWLLLSAALTAACSLVAPKFERPDVTVASVQLVSGNLLQQNFLVTFNIVNPNNRALPVTGLHAELNVGGARLASGVSNRPFVVPADGTTQFDMTISANMAVALLQLSQRPDNHANAIDYEMTGAASVDLPFVHDLPFHQKGSFDLGAR